MEFTAQQLYWMHRAVGQAGAGANLADAEHRFQIRQVLAFTEEERRDLDYREVPQPAGQWAYQFRGDAILERDLSERQAQKLQEVVSEAMPLLRMDVYEVLRPALLQLGWQPPEEDA